MAILLASVAPLVYIISFGIVDDILISDNNISLNLKLAAEKHIIEKIKNDIPDHVNPEEIKQIFDSL